MNKQIFLIVVFLVATTIGNVNARVPIPPPPPPISIPVLETQPDDKKVSLIGYRYPNNSTFQWYTTVKKGIHVIKDNNGYFVLAILMYDPKAYSQNYGILSRYIPTNIRADSPHAIKKKIDGKWRFFIPDTNKEVLYNTQEAILPDWPEHANSSLGWFIGKFKQDGTPIYIQPNSPINNPYYNKYRPPVAGNLDVLMILVLGILFGLKINIRNR